MTEEEYRTQVKQRCHKPTRYQHSNGVYVVKGCLWLDKDGQCTLNACMRKPDHKYETKIINRGKCMLCGKELTEGLFFCKECEADKKGSEGE